MRNLGSLWRRCHEGEIPRGEWEYQRRITINNSTPYKDDLIEDVSVDKGLLYNNYSLGNTVSSKLTFNILPYERQSLRTGDKITYHVRVSTLENGDSPWHSFGTFYADSAEEKNNRWTIEAYDKLASLEKVSIDKVYKGSWPTTDRTLVNSIASYLGVQVDPRTNLRQENIGTTYQLHKQEDLTAREVLGFIGELNGGNWYITEDDRLRLVQIVKGRIPLARVDRSNTKSIIREEPLLVSKLEFSEFSLDAGGGWYLSEIGEGNDAMEFGNNPWFDNRAAQYVLRLLEEYTYYPYDVSSTEIDPAIELGDTLDIEGNITNLWQVKHNTRLYTDFSYPTSKGGQSKSHFNFRNNESKFDGINHNINDLNNRIDLLENDFNDLNYRIKDLEGVAHCTLIIESMLNGNVYNGSARDCVIIPSKLGNTELTKTPHFRGTVPKEIKSASDNITDMSKMFKGANGWLESSLLNLYPNIPRVTFDELDTSNVDDMSEMFMDAKFFGGSFANFDTSNVVNMNSMFRGGPLSSIDVSSFDTSKVVDMGYMFHFNTPSNLNMGSYGRSISGLANLNTENVEDMSHMLYYHDSSLLDRSRAVGMDGIVDWDTSKVVNMEHMLHGRDLSSLPPLNWDVSNVKNFSGMFNYGRINEESLNNFNTSSAVDMSYMFSRNNGRISPSHFITDNVNNMKAMFFEASYVHDADFSGWNTSRVRDMSLMFRGARIEELNMSGWDTSNVTDMSEMFSNTQTPYVDISGLNTSRVRNMEAMFFRVNMQELDFSNFDTSNVTDMSSMFGMSSIPSLDLSSFNTSNVKDMLSMFRSSNIRELDLSNFDTSNVIDMRFMFGDSQFEQLDLRSFDMSRISRGKSISFDGQYRPGYVDMFINTPLLRRVYVNTDADRVKMQASGDTSHIDFIVMNPGVELPPLPPTVQFGNFEIRDDGSFKYIGDDNMIMLSEEVGGPYYSMLEDFDGDYIYVGSEIELSNIDEMFKDSNVSVVDISSLDLSKSEPIKDLFKNTPNLEKVYVNKEEDREILLQNGLVNDNIEIIVAHPIFEPYFFNPDNYRYEGTAERFTIPKVIRDEETTSVRNMFSSTRFNKLDLDFEEYEIITDAGMMFEFAKVTDIELDKLNTSSIVNMSYMFTNIENSEHLDLSSFNTSNVINMLGMFYNAKDLKSVDLSSFNTSNVTNMSRMFQNTRNLTEIDLSSFDTSNVKNMDRMFSGTSATIGYARTQDDADRLNNSSHKPEHLTFVVKD